MRRIGAIQAGAISIVVLTICATVAACAPASYPRIDVDSSGSAAPRAARALRLGLTSSLEPNGGIIIGGLSVQGKPEHAFLLHAGLTHYDGQGQLLPRLAQRVPSVDTGDWQVFADGTMQLTWKLRPDALWHDGVPLIANDFVFGFRVLRDPEIPNANIARGPIGLISEVVAADDHTLIVRWSRSYAFANDEPLGDMPAFPEHLFSDVYPANKQAFINSPYWTQQWVGLGPYRMVDWIFGSRMEMTAFDQYFLGRPRIDRVVITYFGNVNGLVTSLLSGDVDVAPVGSLKTEQVVALKKGWDGTGVGITISGVVGSRGYRFQFRDATAPWVRDLRVRQGLSHLIDRQSIVDSLLYGLTEPAMTFVPPEEPAFLALKQRGFTGYPYDPTEAHRLLGAAGWSRGSDGVYQSADREPFAIELRTSDNPDYVQLIEALANEWRHAGLNTVTSSFSGDATNSSELRASAAGLLFWANAYIPTTLQSFISSQIPSANNRWMGRNYGGYANPQLDQLYDRYLTTPQPAERLDAFVSALKIMSDNAVTIDVYYERFTAAVRTGVRGPGPVRAIQPTTVWNVHEWELEA